MTTLATGVLGITGLIAKGINASGSVSQDLQIWGLSHLIGKTVSAFVDGSDTGDFTVAADGSITVDISSSDHPVTAATLVASDDDWGESTTPCYVQNGSTAVWTNVGIVVGQPYVSQGQRLRPVLDADLASRIGGGIGFTIRTHHYAILFQDAVIVKVGTVLLPSPDGNMEEARFPGSDEVTLHMQPYSMFSGVHDSFSIDDSYSSDSQLCWQVDRPWPCTVCAVTQFLVAEGG